MKPLRSFAISLVALAALLSGPASHATKVADKPLKASVLVKPNVIFGMDDSGSMDWEVLLNTDSGMVWWDGASAWDSANGRPVRGSATFFGYSYLMPVGDAVGGQIYAYNTANGLALPPTNQFAWLRSAAFNPLYYDTHNTYKPWPGSYIKDGPPYLDASTSSAPSHPNHPAGPTLNLGVGWNSFSPNFAANGYRFFVQAGMTLPVGTRVPTSTAGPGGIPCSTASVFTLTAEQTVRAGFQCFASIPYFPATFWQDENCVIGADCVSKPTGVGTLKRYVIKPGVDFPSKRSAEDELKNFANWFTYYRKRKLMLAGAMGSVMKTISGLNVGVVPFNDLVTPVAMYDTDEPPPADNRQVVARAFYTNGMSAQGTPTHDTINYIGGQFGTNTDVVKFACQRNSTFIVTDGFSNQAAVVPPPWDAGKSAATWGAGTPYQTTFEGTQADLALRYYTNRLRPALPAGKVPRSSSALPSADGNEDLHVNFYAITLGVRGSLWPTSTDPYTTPPAWTSPVRDDPSLVDDLWHATLNGRGKMYLASNPTDTAASVLAGLNDIKSEAGAQGSVGVSTVNLGRGDGLAYYGAYDPAGWTGDLIAHVIDPKNGVVGAEVWKADELLRARPFTDRVIASTTTGGPGGSPFTSTEVGSLVNPGNVYGPTSAVIDYLRGDRSNEGTLFRTRRSLMGAVINSEPLIDREQKVVYIQSGEGMLHAFDITRDVPDTGKELWAFVPRSVLANIGATTSPNYIFRTKLDGALALGKFSATGKLLVAGSGVAGRGFHALDVTSPRGLSGTQLAGKVKWEFPRVGDSTVASRMGLAVGRPLIVRTASNGYVVLVTSGYNNTADGKGRLWMLNADTGAVIKTFTVSAGTSTNESGLAQVSGFEEPDGTVRYVYGGDLLGNVWRFDLGADGDTPAAELLAVLKDGAGNAQPVTAAPELSLINDKRIVIVGTGRLLDISDFGSLQVQSLYVIADGTTISNARSTLVRQTYNRATNVLGSATVDWAVGRGWFVDMTAGEQINSKPVLANGAIAWVGNIAGKESCSSSSYLYLLNLETAGAYEQARFVSYPLSETSNFSAPALVGTTENGPVITGQTYNREKKNKPIGPLSPVMPDKNAWIEIRR